MKSPRVRFTQANRAWAHGAFIAKPRLQSLLNINIRVEWQTRTLSNSPCTIVLGWEDSSLAFVDHRTWQATEECKTLSMSLLSLVILDVE
jgi:hypothetical protein